MANVDSYEPLGGWDEPIETSIGLVQWQQLSPPFGGRQIWYGMLLAEDPDRALIGFLSVDDPTSVDEETRRPSDPTDLRIDTIWVHPGLRGRGVGTLMQGLARQTRMFQSHSTTRTEAGSRLAAAVDGADADEVTEIPDAEVFDRGAQRTYMGLIAANPDCRQYVIPQ